MATDNLKKDYNERIVPLLMKQFGYSSVMQVPSLTKKMCIRDSITVMRMIIYKLLRIMG